MRVQSQAWRRPRVQLKGGESGAVAVEFALVLPILVMLLLGIVTAGLSYSHGIGLTNAVREGARFGATADATAGTWANDVITRTRATQFDDHAPIKKTSVCVQLFKGGASPQAAPVCDPAGGPPLALADAPEAPAGLDVGTCVVRVWAARNFQIVTGFSPTVTRRMVRGSVSRYEQDTC